MKKLFIILFVVILIMCLFILKPSKVIEFSTINKLKVYEKYKLSDILELDLIDNYEIFEQELGSKTYYFSYRNNNKIYKGKITLEIVDDIKPLVMLGDSYSIYVDSDEDLTMKILTADNYDANPRKEIIGFYDNSVIGEYPLLYKATDSSGNETIVSFTLKVKEKPKNSSSSNTYTSYESIIEKYKNDNTKIGIDVSSWQDDINFSKIKNAGVEFMFIRVGSQKGFNGDSFQDSYFKKNIEGANANNIDAGIYYFSYATTKEEAHEQALWVIEQIKDYDINLPIAFDWESFDKFNTLKINLYDFNEIANEFIKTINEHGYEGIIYGSKNYLENIWKPTSRVWLAHYTSKTNYANDYFVWQLCNNGKITGINGYVDIDVMYNID